MLCSKNLNFFLKSYKIIKLYFPEVQYNYSPYFILGSLSMYAENCDKSVLKRLLKQLWRIVMKSLERNVVLPPMSEKVTGSININVIWSTSTF
jgi:hypothetical protein